MILNQQIDRQKCIISRLKYTAYRNKSIKLGHWNIKREKVLFIKSASLKKYGQNNLFIVKPIPKIIIGPTYPETSTEKF